jgi:hypothetical protein
MKETVLDTEVRAIQAAHPSWSYGLAFAHALEMRPELGGFAKTPTGSRLAMAAQQDDGTDFPADDGTGWRAAMKRLAQEAQDATSAKVALIPSQHRGLIKKILELLAANEGWSMDQALSKALEIDPSLGERS